jgi:hypothetical protein
MKTDRVKDLNQNFTLLVYGGINAKESFVTNL